MSANKIKKPILLIHGEEDNNPGTLTMQVKLSFPLCFHMMRFQLLVNAIALWQAYSACLSLTAFLPFILCPHA